MWKLRSFRFVAIRSVLRDDVDWEPLPAICALRASTGSAILCVGILRLHPGMRSHPVQREGRGSALGARGIDAVQCSAPGAAACLFSLAHVYSSAIRSDP